MNLRKWDSGKSSTVYFDVMNGWQCKDFEGVDDEDLLLVIVPVKDPMAVDPVIRITPTGVVYRYLDLEGQWVFLFRLPQACSDDEE